VQVSEETFSYVCKLVRREAAIELSAGKEYLVASRLAPLAKKHGHASVDELVSSFGRGLSRDLRREVVEALTTNETYFFRDGHPFEGLRLDLLPSLFVANQATRSIDVWCAACSTGQEPYTLAMLLREHFPDTRTWRIRILATDINEAVLARARAGKYRQTEVSRGLPAIYLAKYFDRSGADWKLKPEIRNMVRFQQLNLIEPWPALGPFDLVLMRNVLIYFAEQTKQRVLSNAAKCLRSQGALLMGASESTIGLDVPLRRVSIGKSTAYQVNDSVAA
jgi:chemotaxis protein methyltransferase CheR